MRIEIHSRGLDTPRVRAALGIDAVTVGSTESFSIFEFSTDSRADDLELCFEDELASAMIPLPNGRARWSFQLSAELDRLPDLTRLRALLSERAPWYANETSEVEWGSVMHFERRLARSLGEDMAQLRDASPTAHARDIRARVLLVQGMRDRRVSPEHLRATRRALDEAGIAYDGYFPSDETHGFYGEESRRKYYESVLRFLDRNLAR